MITKAWVRDTAERTLGTFVVVFVMTWIAPVFAAIGNGGDVPRALHGILITAVAWKAVLAGFAAAGVVVKSAIAPLLRKLRGGTGAMSPASFAKPVQPEQAETGSPPSGPRQRRHVRRRRVA